MHDQADTRNPKTRWCGVMCARLRFQVAGCGGSPVAMTCLICGCVVLAAASRCCCWLLLRLLVLAGPVLWWASFCIEVVAAICCCLRRWILDASGRTVCAATHSTRATTTTTSTTRASTATTQRQPPHQDAYGDHTACWRRLPGNGGEKGPSSCQTMRGQTDTEALPRLAVVVGFGLLWKRLNGLGHAPCPLAPNTRTTINTEPNLTTAEGRQPAPQEQRVGDQHSFTQTSATASVKQLGRAVPSIASDYARLQTHNTALSCPVVVVCRGLVRSSSDEFGHTVRLTRHGTHDDGNHVQHGMPDCNRATRATRTLQNYKGSSNSDDSNVNCNTKFTTTNNNTDNSTDHCRAARANTTTQRHPLSRSLNRQAHPSCQTMRCQSDTRKLVPSLWRWLVVVVCAEA